MSVAIKCKFDERVPVGSLQPHPKNRNVHPPEQIERLAKMIDYQGIRAPIIVSELSKFIVKGHGTLQALIKLGLETVPVVFQSFESEEQEYAFLQGDNAIAEWADLDLAAINSDLGTLGPDFDLEQLGLKDFVLEPAESEFPKLPDGDKSGLEQITFTLSAAQAQAVRQRIAEVLERGVGEFAENANKNGNALYVICTSARS